MLSKVNTVAKIVSGGQSGADRAALDFAIDRGIEYGGWCPAGGWAEDYPQAPGLLEKYPCLKSTGDEDIDVRTRWNVRDSSASVIFKGGEEVVSPGTNLTVETAKKLGRPHIFMDPESPERLAAFIAQLPENAVLNVAGPRESEFPGLYKRVYALLSAAWSLS